ncbi:hypothetical protein J6E39_08090 [bacterium]|nr:hypothetical protein [bacterium]
MNNYNLGNLISKFVNNQTAKIKINQSGATAKPVVNSALPQNNTQSISASGPLSVSGTVSSGINTVQIANLTNTDMSAYVKDLMKLPKHLNELIYVLQRNLTQAQFNRQFASMINKTSITPTQAQIMAQLQTLDSSEVQNLLKNMNTTLSAQLQTALKDLPIKSTGLINLAEISNLIQANGKDAITNLIMAMANSAKQGVNDLAQMKDTAKLINASVAAAAQNDNAQTLKLLMLLYLPWLPLQEGTGFDLEIEANKEKSESDSILIITITTINYGIVKATLILESSNSVHVSIECSKDFPKEELLLRIEGEEKHYSLQSVVSFETSEKSKSAVTEKPQAKINMANTNEINPYLLLMAHTLIRHTLEIDRNKSEGIVSHID